MIAAREGIAQIVYGANVDDLGDHRPGAVAARERGVRAPLMEAGMTKADIREAAHRFGVPNWDKPAMACLSSRVPYGTAIDAGVLQQVWQGERFLRDLGLRQLRVRHHGDTARLEVPLDALPQLVDPQTRAAHRRPLQVDRLHLRHPRPGGLPQRQHERQIAGADRGAPGVTRGVCERAIPRARQRSALLPAIPPP